MLIPLVFYPLMYDFLYQGGGAPSTFTLWLNITRENYYFYNQFLLALGLLMVRSAESGVRSVECGVRTPHSTLRTPHSRQIR